MYICTILPFIGVKSIQFCCCSECNTFLVDCQGHIFLLKIQTNAHVHPPNLKHNLSLNIPTDAALAAGVMIEGRIKEEELER